MVAGFGLQLVALYTPFFQRIFQLVSLQPKDWLIIVAIGVINILAIEITKSFFIFAWKRKRKRSLNVT